METDVDSLMSLLKNKKNISIKDAAKELGVTPEVVEEWARYFEEEGLVKITYQFTTPFIQWQDEENSKGKQNGLLTKKKMGLNRVEDPFKPEVPKKEYKEETISEPKSLLSNSDKTSAQIKDVSQLMTQAHTSVLKGEFDKAKKTYEQLYDVFNKIPGAFLEKIGQIEDDLIKLNNEIVVKLDNKVQDEMIIKQAEILRLLKEAYKYLKEKDFDKSVNIYNNIKIIYKQLPSGFFEEKIILTKKVLEFYENLNNLRSKLADDTLKEKSKIIEKQLSDAKLALKTQNIDEATMAYSLAKETYSALPEGFFEEKVILQEKILEVNQQIIDTKKIYSVTDAQSKLKLIRKMIVEIESLLKNHDIISAVQRYGEIKTLYSQMPKGFIKNEHIVQNEILNSYKEITTAKNNLALEAIKNGRKKIQSYLEKGKKCVLKKNPDLGFQYYKESVEMYNTLPKGFDKTKVQVRNMIYDTYFEIVSNSDMITLGELQNYAKEKYFSLLKLIINAYESISTGRFSLLSQIYKSIYLIYQELPLSLVSQKTKLKEEIKNIYQMYKLYLMVEELEDSQELKNYSHIQSLLTEISGLIEEINKVPNSAPLINYVKSKIANYQVKNKRITEKENKLELPAPSDELYEKNRIDELMIKSMNYFTIKNYPKSIAYLNEIFKIDNEYGPAKAMMEEINLEKKGKGTITLSKADEMVASAIVKFEEFDYNGALADAEKALKVDPNNEEAFLIIQKAKAAIRQR